MFTYKATDPEINKAPDFPKLMQARRSKVIVLMTAYEIGVVVANPDSYNYIGRNCGGWDMSAFDDYNGEVTLKNS